MSDRKISVAGDRDALLADIADSLRILAARPRLIMLADGFFIPEDKPPNPITPEGVKPKRKYTRRGRG